MNTFRIEGTIHTELPEKTWWNLFESWLIYDSFTPDNDSNNPPLFPNGEDLIELSKQETNYEVM